MLALYNYIQAFKRKKTLNEIKSNHTPLLVSFSLSFSDPISYRDVSPVEKNRIIYVPNNLLIQHNNKEYIEFFNRLIMNIVDQSAPRYFSENDLCDCSELQISTDSSKSVSLTCVNKKYFSPDNDLIAEHKIQMVQLCNAKIGVEGSKLLSMKNFKVSNIENIRLNKELKYFIYKHKDFGITPMILVPNTVINYWGYSAI